MRRRKLLLVLVGVAVVVAAEVVVLWPRLERITRENFARLHSGMSRAEVQAILGTSGEYSTGPIEYTYFCMGEPPDVWESDQGVILVFYGAPPVACDIRWIVPKRKEVGPLGRLLWRAKRQWHCWFPE
jgi:hypothetical protein